MFFGPGLVAVTLTAKVQEAPPASVAPASEIVFEPAVAVIVPPPHEPVRPLGVATTDPPGNVSVNATPVSAVDVFELLIVSVRLVVPFSGMVSAPKALAIRGGLMTVILAEDVELAPVPAAVELMVTLLV